MKKLLALLNFRKPPTEKEREPEFPRWRVKEGTPAVDNRTRQSVRMKAKIEFNKQLYEARVRYY